MTKRIVSGIFILTALGALGVILAGALTSGEQLIVRFLTAVIVAALGLYVISDLRLQADSQATNRRTRSGPATFAAVGDLPANSTAAFMATVTAPRRPEELGLDEDSGQLTEVIALPIGASTSKDEIASNAALAGSVSPKLASEDPDLVESKSALGETAEVEAINVEGPRILEGAGHSKTPFLSLTNEFGDNGATPNGASPNGMSPNGATPDGLETNALVIDLDESDDIFLALTDEQPAISVDSGSADASADSPATADNGTSGSPWANSHDFDTEPDDAGRDDSDATTLSAVASIQEPPLTSDEQASESQEQHAWPVSASYIPDATADNESPVDATINELVEVSGSDSRNALETVSIDAPLGVPIDALTSVQDKEETEAPDAEPVSSVALVDKNQQVEAADYADAPLAPIIDLREVHSFQTAGNVDNAIRAGEIEVISTLIEQGMLSTDGEISDRDVRTMVYVAFTSNELRKLLLAGGTPDGQNQGLDLGPVELFDETLHSPAPKTLYQGNPRKHGSAQPQLAAAVEEEPQRQLG